MSRTMARMLPVTADTVRLFLHVLAAAVWVGGQITLVAILPVLRGAGADVPRAAARSFGRIAWTAFAVLIVTGIWNIASADDTNPHAYQRPPAIQLGFIELA